MPSDLLCAKKNLCPGTPGSVVEIYYLASSSAGCLDVFANSYWLGLWPLILYFEAALFFLNPPSGDKIKATTQKKKELILPLLPELIEGFAMTQMNIDS